MRNVASTLSLAAALALVSEAGAPEPTIAATRIYYGPSQQIGNVDVETLAGARRSIDMAAFILTDRTVLDALVAAARRGVVIRIYLDRDELDRAPQRAIQDIASLATLGNVSVRAKARNSEAMHLKSYAVDRRLLRTGSANLTYSGERQQDNDVVLLESVPLATAFTRAFDALWTRAGNEEVGR